jgi:hypothetical protein
MLQPSVLMLKPVMPTIADALDCRVVLHRLWQFKDPEEHIARIAPDVRAIMSRAQAPLPVTPVAESQDVVKARWALEAVASTTATQ